MVHFSRSKTSILLRSEVNSSVVGKCYVAAES